MKRKLILAGSSLLLLILAAYFVFIRKGGPKYEFRLDKVGQGDLTVLVTATGTINAVTSVDVGTQVSGIISKLYADFNSVVKEGQVIAQIDPTFLQQSVKDAEANLDRATAQAADNKRILNRTKALYEKNLESQLNYDAAMTSFESSQAGLKQANATLDRAKINLAYATIYAPISGVVIDRKVNVGQTVAASFSSPTLYTIANDLRKMQVQATVDESDIGTISIGQEATFTVDAYPEEKFSGIVSQIRLAPVSIQNVVNYTVIIDVNNAQLKLMPGMTANVKLLVANLHDVLKVPNMALRFQPPAELVDSAKMKSMREAFASRPEKGDTLTRSSAPSGTNHEPGPPRNTMAQNRKPDSPKRGDKGSSEGQEDRRRSFGAARDSILAAHGGEMSPEGIRAEMSKIFEARRAQSRQQQQEVKPVYAPVPESNKFGITQRFPQYQKSAYVPVHQSGRARVWILNAQKKLEPVFVRTGLNDGRFTEINTTDLKPGDQIVLGVVSNNDATTDQVRSPLAGQGQRVGGGPR